MVKLRSWRDGSGTRFEGLCQFAVDKSTKPGLESFEIIFPEQVRRFEVSNGESNPADI